MTLGGRLMYNFSKGHEAGYNGAAQTDGDGITDGSNVGLSELHGINGPGSTWPDRIHRDPSNPPHPPQSVDTRPLVLPC
ncbi:uncharacterized protein N7482_006553 [Penicillium canariense]|uniref:Uncharacterized protein n=1 Tax=Penicillium canariense TaxID=189055 RepID=A0A9W9HWK3_9EURO|nr:uncharacterized protein N7482_006553 [Penicillium canariense]KAJ5159549.1 hypothetical protein N7482_006553 [Penicillium canariense]